MMGKTMLEAIFFAVAVVIVVVKGSIDQCPKGLIHDRYLQQRGNSCYEFILNHPGDWLHAEQHCELNRGFLVHIQSAADQAFIYQALRDYNFHGDKGVWIGFTDTQSEGNWKWSSGDHVTYTYWSPGQPSVLAGGLEDCGLLDFSDRGHWHDYPCHGILFSTQNHGWICQYAVLANSTDMVTSSTSKHTVSSTLESTTTAANDMTTTMPVVQSSVSTTLDTTTATAHITTTPIVRSTATIVALETETPPRTGIADTTILIETMPDSTAVTLPTTSG